MNGIIHALRNLYAKEMFYPSYFLGIWINPFFIIRRGLLNGVSQISREVRGGSLLDVGCGSKPYEKLFNVDEYIGIDIEVSGHDHKSTKADYFYDGKIIPFDDEKFDMVFSSEVLEHVFDIDELLGEINRVLRRGGKFALTCPFVWDEHEVPYDFARYTSYGISHLLERHGFEIQLVDKSTAYFPTVMQMLSAYISQHCLPKNPYFRLILTPFFVAPINFIGDIFGRFLPMSKDFYHNNIVVARKIGAN